MTSFVLPRKLSEYQYGKIKANLDRCPQNKSSEYVLIVFYMLSTLEQFQLNINNNNNIIIIIIIMSTFCNFCVFKDIVASDAVAFDYVASDVIVGDIVVSDTIFRANIVNYNNLNVINCVG